MELKPKVIEKPKKSNEPIYLYLAQKNKSTIQIISIIGKGKCNPTRIDKINLLNLPFEKEELIKTIVDNNKMLWDLWMESAADYIALTEKLKSRGFKYFPLTDKPKISEKLKFSNKSIKNLPNQESMLRRKVVK